MLQYKFTRLFSFSAGTSLRKEARPRRAFRARECDKSCVTVTFY